MELTAAIGQSSFTSSFTDVHFVLTEDLEEASLERVHQQSCALFHVSGLTKRLNTWVFPIIMEHHLN